MASRSENGRSSKRRLAEEATVEIKRWREEHPKAAFREIADAVDEHLAEDLNRVPKWA